ncbi:Na+/H+ antiporter NhaC [Aminipila sp.]|uniref:Na+/H+ antiporter NhaC n=1 Tax=Aminipila sp. TaxID=2060095 RepID=UPI00289A41B7|nr:Na+/H+ antiporter NhaC [Aminipila sp.]
MGRKIPMWQCVVTMLFTLIALAYSLGMLGKVFGPAFACDYGLVHIPLICSAIFAAIIAIINGYKWSFLEAGILASINRSMQAMLILLTVGLLIGSWIAGGVVPAMIYYGLKILSPGIFLLASCLLCCIVSLATGSSWTTAGTIGIALIGIGKGLGMDPAMVAGAIVSGAYFGDKMSPLSDTTNLAPAMAGATLFDHIRHMVWTVTPSLVLALIIYGILGMGKAGQTVDMSVVNALQEGLKGNFNINLALLIPPIVVIAIVALRLPALPGLMGGIILGCLFGSIFQGVSLADWPGILHNGFKFANPDAVMPDLVSLLEKGGMASMLQTINLIICAMCFGGIMDASGMLATMAQALLKAAKNTGSLITVTIFSCIFMNVIAGDQYLAIVLPGRMYKEAFEDRKLAPKNLSRALEDSGTITSCLVPWNTCGAAMSTFLGVPTASYGRYAFLNIINPLVSIFYGFTGISMEKMTDEHYAKIIEEREAEKAAALKALEA